MLINVPLDHIDDNPYQRRQDYGDVESLAADIAAKGLLQTPKGRLVFTGTREAVKAEHYAIALPTLGKDIELRVQLAFGHRRLRAYRYLLDKMPADEAAAFATMPVYLEYLCDDAMLDAVWSENQHRSDINPVEQAELLAEKLERVRATGGTQQTVAAEWNLDRSTVANKIRLLDLPDAALQALRGRALSERQALALLPVVDLAERVATLQLNWNKEIQSWGMPAAPETYLDYAVANADKLTGDDIRRYTKQVLDYVGRVLPEPVAKYPFEAMQDVVQNTCAGCRYRHNQHCLNRACLSAKSAHWQKVGLPRIAAEHTGLPWSDPADIARIGYNDRDAVRGLRDAYNGGRRDNLVVTWYAEGWHEGWFVGSPSGYRPLEEIAADWHRGLTLARPAGYEPPTAEAGDKPPLPAWREAKREYGNQRQDRVKRELAEAMLPLGNEPDALRILASLVYRETEADPDKLVRYVVERVVGTVYTSDPADLRKLLKAAGLSDDSIDPPEPLDRLREQAAEALIGWYDRSSDAVAKAAARRVRLVVEHFDAAGITADTENAAEDLRELARWLALALADAEALKTAVPA